MSLLGNLRRIVAALVLLALAGCAGDQSKASLVGKWQVTSMSSGGQTQALSASESAAVFEFFEDGSLTLNTNDPDQPMLKGSYALSDDNQLAMTLNDQTLKGAVQLNDDQFVLTYEEERPASRLHQVDEAGNPINSDGEPATLEPDQMTSIAQTTMTFARVR